MGVGGNSISSQDLDTPLTRSPGSFTSGALLLILRSASIARGELKMKVWVKTQERLSSGKQSVLRGEVNMELCPSSG